MVIQWFLSRCQVSGRQVAPWVDFFPTWHFRCFQVLWMWIDMYEHRDSWLLRSQLLSWLSASLEVWNDYWMLGQIQHRCVYWKEFQVNWVVNGRWWIDWLLTKGFWLDVFSGTYEIDNDGSQISCCLHGPRFRHSLTLRSMQSWIVSSFEHKWQWFLFCRSPAMPSVLNFGAKVWRSQADVLEFFFHIDSARPYFSARQWIARLSVNVAWSSCGSIHSSIFLALFFAFLVGCVLHVGYKPSFESVFVLSSMSYCGKPKFSRFDSCLIACQRPPALS